MEVKANETVGPVSDAGETNVAPARKARRYMLGRPVYTADDRRKRACPLPPDPEWIEEAKRLRSQKG